MNEENIEELLRVRGRVLDGPVLSPERSRELRDRLRREAHVEAGRPPRLVLVGAALAAALLLLITFVWKGGDRAQPLGGVPVEVAWLDGLGRPLESTVRSTETSVHVRPEAFLLEIKASSAGYLTVVLYDSNGERSVPRQAGGRRLAARELELVELSVAALPARPDGDSYVGVVVVTSQRALSSERLEDVFPERIDLTPSEDPAAPLLDLARSVEESLGCRVIARSFRFTPS